MSVEILHYQIKKANCALKIKKNKTNHIYIYISVTKI